MIDKIKQKLKAAWDWTVDKIKRFWKWLLVGGAGIVLAASLTNPACLPETTDYISYPCVADKQMTDIQKLSAVYSLIEQLRAEHNKIGDIAISDWKNNEAKWAAYSQRFREKQRTLLAEQNRLRLKIRDAAYSPSQWDALTEEEKYNAMITLWGDKSSLKTQITPATSTIVEEVKKLTLDNVGTIVDPYEDWTTYTETDPNSVLTVAANQITVTNMQRQSASFVYADKGAGHFGATFQHLIDTRLTAQSGGDFDDMIHFWGVANATAPDHATDPIIMLYWMARPTTGNAHIYLEVDDGVTDASDPTAQIALNTIFYLTIDKNAVDTDALIYSNSTRTTLLDTLTVANGATTYQYIHSGFARGGSSVATMSGDIYNLDLQEAAPSAVEEPPRGYLIE